jgi:hypothetical protein
MSACQNQPEPVQEELREDIIAGQEELKKGHKRWTRQTIGLQDRTKKGNK